jgi:hypothetical protein
MRLLDFWDSLARYTRPLDEDDLVDVLTGEITKDVGVLRNSNKFNFGSLAAPVVDYTSDEGSDTHEELDEDEYGVDELDAFQDEISEAGAPCGLDVGAKIMPLVTPLGPADADDLREFMEAEQKRRELYGSADGEDDEDYSRKAVETDEEPGYETPRYSDDPRTFAGNNEDERQEEEEVEEDAGEEEEEEKEETSATYGNYSDYVVPLNAASDDELDNWDTNAANAVHPVTKQEPENDDDNDSDIEIIDVSPAPKPSQSHKNDKIILGTLPKNSKRTPKPPHQLYTPPQSNSSSGPSATPTNENFIDLSTEPTPSPRSSASGSSPVQSPSKKNQKRQAKDERNHVLQSKTTVDSLKRVQETPVRRIDLSKIRDSSSPVKGTPKRSELSKSSPSKLNGQTPNLKPFVLLTPRKSSSPQKPTRSRSDRIQTEHSPVGSLNISKGKGKAKQAMEETKHNKLIAETKAQLSPTKRKPLQPTPIEPSPAYEDNDSINIPSSSPSKSLRSHLSKQQDDEESFLDTRCTPEVATSRDISENQQFLSPTFPSPPTYRKRKRTPSDVSMESPESNRREVVCSIGKRPPSDISNRRMSTSRFSEGEPQVLSLILKILTNFNILRRSEIPTFSSEEEVIISRATPNTRVGIGFGVG